MRAELIDVISVSNTLGEGVLWDETQQQLWWTDIQERLLYRYTPASRALQRSSLPERLCSFGFVEDSDALIAAFESGFALYQPTSGHLEWLARPPHAAERMRFNDGRVDRQGRFWVGSMVEGEGEPQGKLYCLSGRHCAVHLTGVAISNSICFSPAGDRLYFADTPHATILRFDLNPANGVLSNRQVFARTPPGALPDGSNVDVEGHLWNAHWGGGRVVRYAPDGQISATIEVPCSQPTCIAFGGPQLDWLFVTSARQDLDTAALNRQSQAGHVFVYRVAVAGIPDGRFKLAG
jgi:L-arabinonolactonase